MSKEQPPKNKISKKELQKMAQELGEKIKEKEDKISKLKKNLEEPSIDQQIEETKEKITQLKKEREVNKETEGTLKKMSDDILNLKKEIEEEKKKSDIENVVNKIADDIETKNNLNNANTENINLEKGKNYNLEIDGDKIKESKNEKVEKTEILDGIKTGKIDKNEIKNIIDTREDKSDKKTTQSTLNKINPFSWFKKNKEKFDDSSKAEELLNKNKKNKTNEKIILSHTGAAPAFYEDKIEEKGKTEVKNEKKKTLYTKEQQKEFFDGLKEKLKNKEITEADFRNAVFKRTEEIHNFEKSSVYKAMDKWDNWGKDGGVGKYAKMAINIAMIAGASSFTVNGMAGLTERVLSRTVMGTAVGTGLGGIMTFLDRLPPEKKSKVQKIIKGSLIGGSAIFAIGSGGVLPGLAIGASAAFGYGMSRYYKNWSEKRSNKNINDFKGIPVDLKNIDKNTALIEYRIKEALKQAEKDKIKRKIMSTAISLTSSIATLEVSGLVHDHLNNTSHSETVDGDTNGEHTGDDNTNHEKNQIPEKENDNTNTENDNTQKENNEKIEDTKKSYVGEKEIGAVADKGQGAISTIKELKDNLEKTYENVPEKDIPENVKHIIDTDADDLAKEYGLYRPGEEAESANVLSGDKITLDQETGKVEFHQVKTGEDIVLEKGKDYEGDMFDSGKIKTQVENIETKPNGDETSQFEKEYPQTSPKDEFYSQRYSGENSDKFMGRDSEPGIDQNSNITIDGEEVKSTEISEKELIETKKLAESYGLDSERYRGETESDYLNRMKDEIAEEKEVLKQELASGEKIGLDKTLKVIHGEKVEIEKLRELKEITKGYEGAIGQPSLRDIMEKIKEQGLKAIITKDIGETPTAAHVSVNEKMNLIEKSLGGQKGYNYEFAQKLPDGNVKILHIKLFKE